MNNRLTIQDYRLAANLLNVDVATVRAVAEVESRGGGFLSNGDPKILFEGHWFHKLTRGKYAKEYPKISHYRWTRKYYNMDQYERLVQAQFLDAEAAAKSASWGMFQIMGFNHAKCGYPTAIDMANDMAVSEGRQLQAFVRFILNSGLSDELQEKDWSRFAYLYNGPKYYLNSYDTKIAKAYKKYARNN